MVMSHPRYQTAPSRCKTKLGRSGWSALSKGVSRNVPSPALVAIDNLSLATIVPRFNTGALFPYPSALTVPARVAIRASPRNLVPMGSFEDPPSVLSGLRSKPPELHRQNSTSGFRYQTDRPQKAAFARTAGSWSRGGRLKTHSQLYKSCALPLMLPRR